ncbi:hypothetical protein L2E82_44575 [Cichorium intybus]|uniref:Uncharacterized protein n=1 Tax=Cichorium intybus TaxID=13427 RepID=A0ACB8ZQN8_CICIN|nr:hypothetical protein L2E82_44575 [Cichorium intybus]
MSLSLLSYLQQSNSQAVQQHLRHLCSPPSLVALSFVEFDLEEMNLIMSMREGNLTEHLLPSTNSFFIRESRSSERDANVLLRGAVFRTFNINFLTYGALFCLGVLVALVNLVNNSVFLYLPVHPMPMETLPLKIFLIAMKPGFIHAVYSITTETVTGVSCLGITRGPVEYSDLILWNPLTGPMSFFLRDQSLLHLMSNGNLLIQHVDSLYALDMKKHTKDMVFNTRENMDRLYPYKIPPRGKYIETTVSPNRYMMCRGVGKKPELKLD